MKNFFGMCEFVTPIHLKLTPPLCYRGSKAKGGGRMSSLPCQAPERAVLLARESWAATAPLPAPSPARAARLSAQLPAQLVLFKLQGAGPMKNDSCAPHPAQHRHWLMLMEQSSI